MVISLEHFMNKLNISDEQKALTLAQKNGYTTIEKEGQTFLRQSINQNMALVIELHNKVVKTKNEAIKALQEKNEFLSQTLLKAQQMHDEDRQLLQSATNELQTRTQELQELKKKYSLLWKIQDENTN